MQGRFSFQMAMIICGADNPLKDEGDFEEKSGYFTQEKKMKCLCPSGYYNAFKYPAAC